LSKSNQCTTWPAHLLFSFQRSKSQPFGQDGATQCLLRVSTITCFPLRCQSLSLCFFRGALLQMLSLNAFRCRFVLSIRSNEAAT